jgi:hypothetical protein
MSQATPEDRSRWVLEAKRRRARYVIVACDTFDYEQYPVYAKDAADLAKQSSDISRGYMLRVEDVISVPLAPRRTKMPDRKTKTCRSCGSRKSRTSFMTDARFSDGLDYKCQECRRRQIWKFLQEKPTF